jgi:hypothetical protein
MGTANNNQQNNPARQFANNFFNMNPGIFIHPKQAQPLHHYGML